MPEKVTTMVLKVDLQCSSCYMKIKKILCKLPQIRDQIYDEKQNTVTIVVVCCSPEKVRDKLYCKGGKTIKCIKIKEPPKEEPPKKETPKQEPPKQEPPKKETPKEEPPKKETPKQEPPKKETPKKEPEKTKEPPRCPPAFVPAFVPVCYPPMYPVGICCGQCYEGRTDGPCYHGHRRPVPPHDNYGCGPCGCGCGGNRACYTSRCDYFSEENPSGCTIM